MHIYIHVYTYIYTYTHVYAYIQTYMHIYIHIHTECVTCGGVRTKGFGNNSIHYDKDEVMRKEDTGIKLRVLLKVERGAAHE